MGVCSSQTSAGLPTSSLPSYPDYTGAGILFVGGPVALAGVQKYYRVAKGAHAILSGFGGAKEATDGDWLDTAWREVIEELLGVAVVPPALLRALRTSVPLPIPPRTNYISGYVLLCLEFYHLKEALTLCRIYGVTSPLYAKPPMCISDLVLLRRPSEDAEIGALALLPVSHRVAIASEYAGDLASFRVPSPSSSSS
jgi:hypothetical protein